MDVELLLDAHATIGEAPTWVPEEDAVYWIDIKAPALHRLGLGTGADRTWRLPADVGAFALLADGKALVALRNGLHTLDLATGSTDLVAPPPFDPARHRFNEGACDGTGRFWVGTMFDPLPAGAAKPEHANLYSFTLADGLRPEPDSTAVHNGMAWSADGTVFYLSHSQDRTVFAFAFDAATGRLGARRRFVTASPDEGIPDGAAVDAEGCYWCAMHGGWRLHRYRPDGTLDREVRLPVSQPTMCAFAGEDLRLMVVTSASDQLGPDQLAREPHAGGLFCFRPGVSGIPRPYLAR